MINEMISQIGKISVKIIDKQTGIVTEDIIFNRIMDVALQKMINAYDGVNPDMEIKYIAIGNSSTAISDSQTTLGNELYRFPISTGTNNDTGEFTSTFIVLDSEAVTTWEEIGFFCGSAATTTLNTGTMLSRILYHRVKTASEEIQFSRLDKLTRK